MILSHHGLLEYGSPVRPKDHGSRDYSARSIIWLRNDDDNKYLGLIGPGEINKIFAENRSSSMYRISTSKQAGNDSARQ